MPNKILHTADVKNLKYVIWQDEMTQKHARLAGRINDEWATLAVEGGMLRPFPAHPWLVKALDAADKVQKPTTTPAVEE